MRRQATLLLLASAAAYSASQAAVTVRDDDGNTVTLQQPAQRIISLAPHVTELLFAAGGGDRIVGAVAYSDYPEAALNIPRIGDNLLMDMERIAAMKPDLIVIWRHSDSTRQAEALRQLGIPIFHSEPQTLDAIADSVLRLGQLMGTEDVARPAAAGLRRQLAALANQYSKRPPVRMFYQVWDKPLYTLNGAHIVSDAIRLCGGANIFADLKTSAPVVDIEAVLQQDPEAVIGTSEKNYGSIDLWRPYRTMKAVRNDNLFKLNGDLLNRAGPRMIEGAAALCEKLELARQHRKN